MIVISQSNSRIGILENNLVQTAASAGEALAAGVIFTFPALVIMHDSQNDAARVIGWKSIRYGETVILSICGGLLSLISLFVKPFPFRRDGYTLQYPHKKGSDFRDATTFSISRRGRVR
jgi:uncharacterized oligopeptide transporter (OPT) family protein